MAPINIGHFYIFWMARGEKYSFLLGRDYHCNNTHSEPELTRQTKWGEGEFGYHEVSLATERQEYVFCKPNIFLSSIENINYFTLALFDDCILPDLL